jgi:hypothetical protein
MRTFDLLHSLGLSVEPSLPAVVDCAPLDGAASAPTSIAVTRSESMESYTKGQTNFVGTSIHDQ